MSLASAIRETFAGTPTAAEQRAAAIDRRRKLAVKIDSINAKIKTVAADLALTATAPAALATADKAYVDGRVAAELGESGPIALESLRMSRDTARQTAEAGAERAIDLERVLAAYRGQLEPLRAAQQAIRTELADLAPAVLDGMLLALKPRRDEAVRVVLALLREEARLTLAYDEYSMATARGEFRGSADYADIRIPHPNHPAYRPSYGDIFERGRALTAAHDAFREDQQAIDREAQALINTILNGD